MALDRGIYLPDAGEVGWADEVNDNFHRLADTGANVKAYGAKGDSTTDDTAAFQAAIDANVYVRVPPSGGNYVIKNKLMVTNANGLFLQGVMQGGGGTRIVLRDFPPNTDVFELGTYSFPLLQLRDLYFYGEGANPPRDLVRMTKNDDQHFIWENLDIQHLAGRAFNSNGFLLVGARFRNVHTVFCGNGWYFSGSTATVLENCRWAANHQAGGATIDLEALGSNQLTLLNPIFDGTSPGDVDYTRCKIQGAGIVIQNPYVEWVSTAANGTLCNFELSGTYITLSSGLGGVVPVGGTHTFVPLKVNGANIALLNPPIQTWSSGSTTTSLQITNSSGVIAFVGDSDSKISVDSTSMNNTVIYNSGNLRWDARRTGLSVTGATPDMQGYPLLFVSNASPTNMTNLLGGQSGRFVRIWFTTGNTTLIHGAGGVGSFELHGDANYAVPSGTVLDFLWQSSSWHEVGRP